MLSDLTLAVHLFVDVFQYSLLIPARHSSHESARGENAATSSLHLDAELLLGSHLPSLEYLAFGVKHKRQLSEIFVNLVPVHTSFFELVLPSHLPLLAQ